MSDETTIRAALRRFTQENRGRRARVTAIVAGVVELTPSVLRVELEGEELGSFPVTGLPADAVRLFLPDARGHEVSRPYTVRSFDHPARTMAIDVVVHGDGPGSAWARTVRAGDRVTLAGPRHEFWAPPQVDHHVLVGDASALPAIAAIVEHLDPALAVDAIVAVEDGDHELDLASDRPGVRVRWLHRGGPSLAAAVDVVPLDPDRTQVWIAGEVGDTRAVRSRIVDAGRLPATAVRAVGYWRRGATTTQLDDERIASGDPDPEIG